MTSETFYKINGLKEAIALLTQDDKNISNYNFIKLLEQLAEVAEELDKRITEQEAKTKKIKRRLDE